MSKQFADVIEFNKKVINLEPTECLNEERLAWFKGVINEELGEFETANKKYSEKLNDTSLFGSLSEDELLEIKAEMADAIIDLLYFAYGRLFEIGITEVEFNYMWQEIQKANMAKVKGNKGRGSDDDAVKPEDWQAPEKKFLNIMKGRRVTNLEEYYNNGCTVPSTDALNYVELDKQMTEQAVEVLTTPLTPPGQEWTVELMNAMPKAFIEATKLCMKKSQDYNNGQNKPASRKDYFPFGLLSYAQMLHTKTQRLNSLAQQHGKTPNNESVRDTLIDLINYANFAIEAIDKGEI